MKILQLCNKPPNPPVDGGCMSMDNFTQGLIQAGHEVKVLTLETHKHKLRLKEISDSYKKNTNIEGVFVDTKINIVDAFSSIVTSDSYNINRFFSADFDIRLSKILQEKEYDIVQLESLFMTPYIPMIRRKSKARIILRSHNLEYQIWERMAISAKNPAKKIYLKFLAKQLKKYEVNVLNDVDGIVAITRLDEEKYKKLNFNTPIVTVPFGIDIENYAVTSSSPDDLSLFYLGSMDWLPNQQGVTWFLDEVWAKVLNEVPKVAFYLAGRKMPESYVSDPSTNFEVVGEVDDAHDFMSSKSIMLVPLLSGGGMRVKIIEAMALGKTIISTKIGAEGIEYTKNSNILIADTPEDFVKSIKKLFLNKKECKLIGQRARIMIEKKYNNKLLTKKIVSFYQEIISQ